MAFESSPIQELIDSPPEHQGVWNMVYNTMRHQADQCPYVVIFTGPWGFEPEIGAHCLREARGTAKAFAKERPETESYEIWDADGRIEVSDLVPPSDDPRVLQALGWS